MCNIFIGKPAYHMNTCDVDWSPSINLGHDKLDHNKLIKAQERAERAH